MSRVGSDFPAAFLETIASSGIDVAGIRHSRGRSSHFSVEYDERGKEHYDAAVFGVGEMICSLDFPHSFYAARALLINSMRPDIQPQWVEMGKAEGMLTGLTTNFLYLQDTELRGHVLEALGGVDVFVCNRREAEVLSGYRGGEPDLLLRKLAHRCACPIITQGGDAVWFLDGTTARTRAVVARTVVDPTGAGDSFAGAVLANLASSRSIVEAIDSALLVSADAVAGIGPSALLFKRPR